MTIAAAAVASQTVVGSLATATFGVVPGSGHVLLALVTNNGLLSLLTREPGWTLLTQELADHGSGYFGSAVLVKVCGPSESATQTPAHTSGSTTLTCQIVRYTGFSTSSPVLVAASFEDLSTAGKTSPLVTPTAGVEILVFGAAHNSNAGASWSGEQVNSSATGVTERSDNGYAAVWDRIIASSSGSYDASATLSAGGSDGSAHIVILTSGTTSGGTGGSGGGGGPALSVIPDWIWEIDFTNGPGAAGSNWVDVTQYVRGATIRRGRQVETGRDQASTCSLDLLNVDRRFDWYNTLSPYYPGIKPMRRVRCRAIYGGVLYPQIYAFLDDPVQEYPGYADAVVHLSATDAFKILSNKLVSGDFPAQRSDLRFAAILDAIGWPAALRSLAVGVSLLDPITLDRVSALEHLQQVAESESGRLFVDTSGRIKFIDRHAPYLTTSQATFGEQEINYVDVTFAGGDALIYNEILVQRAADGAELRSAVDAASQLDYFARSLSHTGMLFNHDNEGTDKANFELSIYKDFRPRIDGMILDGSYQPALIWPQALGRELGDRLTVRKRPPGGGSLIEQESFVEGIEHSIGVGTWDTTVRLSAIGIGYQIYPSGKAFFELGHPTNGKIGASQPGVLAY